jgi:hypothetical protein
MPLDGMDMVLGTKWLIQLCTYATNLQEQFMEFKWHRKDYKLGGLEIFCHKVGLLQTKKENVKGKPFACIVEACIILVITKTLH